MEVVRAEGKSVLVAVIAPSAARPVYAREEDGSRRAYVRVKDENIAATPVHLRLWREERDGRGALMTFTEREHRLLRLLDEAEGLTLNQFCRRAGEERCRAVTLLARFVRFGVAEMCFSDHRFRFRTSV